MNVRWSPDAATDLEAIHDYIAGDNPVAAEKTVDTLYARIGTLARAPHIGRIGRLRGTRELVIPPFVVVYRVREGHVEIAAILHGAQSWPDS